MSYFVLAYLFLVTTGRTNNNSFCASWSLPLSLYSANTEALILTYSKGTVVAYAVGLLPPMWGFPLANKASRLFLKVELSSAGFTSGLGTGFAFSGYCTVSTIIVGAANFPGIGPRGLSELELDLSRIHAAVG